MTGESRGAFAESLALRLQPSLVKRFSWVDREELFQFIFLATLEISDAYADKNEAECGAIAYKTAYRLVAREVLKASSPVSESWHNLRNLKQAKGAPLNDIALKSTYPQPDELAEQFELHTFVRSAAYKCALEIPLGALATRVILDEETPRNISEETGVNRKAIYSAVDQLKRKLKPILEERLNDYSFCC